MKGLSDRVSTPIRHVLEQESVWTRLNSQYQPCLERVILFTFDRRIITKLEVNKLMIPPTYKQVGDNLR